VEGAAVVAFTQRLGRLGVRQRFREEEEVSRKLMRGEVKVSVDESGDLVFRPVR
jgi:hypothetical protein